MRSLLLLLCALTVGTLALTPAEIREFKVRDVVEHNTGLKGVVTVTEGTDTITIVSNAIPDHATPTYPRPGNYFPIVPQNLRITLPKNPQVANQTTCLNMGAVGVAINGVPIYNPFSLECRDASVYETLDQCDGHPSPQGEYHYHIHPDCVFDGTSTHSQIVGVAADGFAIYGPVDEDGIVLTNADLDECHGRMKDGVYRYHVTNEYPYFMACYKGVVRPDSGVDDGQFQCMCPIYPDGTSDIENSDPYPYPTPQDLPPDFLNDLPNDLQLLNGLQQLHDLHQHNGLQQLATSVRSAPLQDNPTQQHQHLGEGDTAQPQSLLEDTAQPQPLTLYQIWQQHQPTCQEWQLQQWKNFERAFQHWQQQQQSLHRPATAQDAVKNTQFRPRAPFPSQ
ncbi:uncharacterized protein LOC118423577 [Branchiostoma floridae]|uniref:Uncharacterized protein LOC118423577 n=1 Tax=Branchiostoma floridae TaxID=7739 RepID=A0A9J7N332_BRAFL|nr:uncharacterized protein LOC118423577 [Branchiostoma floridae]